MNDDDEWTRPEHPIPLLITQRGWRVPIPAQMPEDQFTTTPAAAAYYEEMRARELMEPENNDHE